MDLVGAMTFLKCFSRFLITQGKKNNIINLSAQMSYRALLAFIPFIMLLYNLINWFSIEINTTLVFVLSEILPTSIMNYVYLSMENANTISFSFGTNLLIGFFIFYASVSAMHSLIQSLNYIFEQNETRGIIALWIQSVLYLFLFLSIIVLTLFFYIFGEKLFDFIFTVFNLSGIFTLFIAVFSCIYLVFVTTFIFTFIYMFAPKNHLTFLEAFPGGLFVSICWFSILFIYALFANSILDYATFSINLQGPFSLFFVIYIICFTLALGGVVNLFSVKLLALRERKVQDD